MPFPVSVGIFTTVSDSAEIASLRRGRYTLIRVIGRGDRLLGTLDEGALLEGLMRRGEQVTLGELVFLFDR